MARGSGLAENFLTFPVLCSSPHSHLICIFASQFTIFSHPDIQCLSVITGVAKNLHIIGRTSKHCPADTCCPDFPCTGCNRLVLYRASCIHINGIIKLIIESIILRIDTGQRMQIRVMTDLKRYLIFAFALISRSLQILFLLFAAAACSQRYTQNSCH